jgi:hypothetical protein
MGRDAEELFHEAMKLPERDREDLTLRLLEVLHVGPEEDPLIVAQAWREEIERRVRRVVEGGERGIPADQVISELKAKLTRVQEPPKP